MPSGRNTCWSRNTWRRKRPQPSNSWRFIDRSAVVGRAIISAADSATASGDCGRIQTAVGAAGRALSFIGFSPRQACGNLISKGETSAADKSSIFGASVETSPVPNKNDAADKNGREHTMSPRISRPLTALLVVSVALSLEAGTAAAAKRDRHAVSAAHRVRSAQRGHYPPYVVRRQPMSDYDYNHPDEFRRRPGLCLRSRARNPQ